MSILEKPVDTNTNTPEDHKQRELPFEKEGPKPWEKGKGHVEVRYESGPIHEVLVRKIARSGLEAAQVIRTGFSETLADAHPRNLDKIFEPEVASEPQAVSESEAKGSIANIIGGQEGSSYGSSKDDRKLNLDNLDLELASPVYSQETGNLVSRSELLASDEKVKPIRYWEEVMIVQKARAMGANARNWLKQNILPSQELEGLEPLPHSFYNGSDAELLAEEVDILSELDERGDDGRPTLRSRANKLRASITGFTGRVMTRERKEGIIFAGVATAAVGYLALKGIETVDVDAIIEQNGLDTVADTSEVVDAAPEIEPLPENAPTLDLNNDGIDQTSPGLDAEVTDEAKVETPAFDAENIEQSGEAQLPENWGDAITEGLETQEETADITELGATELPEGWNPFEGLEATPEDLNPSEWSPEAHGQISPSGGAASLVEIAETAQANGNHPYSVLLEHGIAEADIMPTLESAGQQLAEETGADVKWYGSGTTRWISIDGVSDTRSVVTKLAPYISK